MHLCSHVSFLTMCFHKFPRATLTSPSMCYNHSCTFLNLFHMSQPFYQQGYLITSACNHVQGDIVQPTIQTHTPNDLRPSWDFLPGRSPDMLVGLAASTFLVLEGGLDDKLCPLILFWKFSHISWILWHSSLHDVFRMPNVSTSWGISFTSCINWRMMLKAK